MTVKDHSSNPRNEGVLDNANGVGKGGGGKECSDVIKFYIRVEGDVITEAKFQCDGCETTVACGSITTELAKGKHLDEAGEIAGETIVQALGGLAGEYRHCAATAAEALSAAIWDYTIHGIEKTRIRD